MRRVALFLTAAGVSFICLSGPSAQHRPTLNARRVGAISLSGFGTPPSPGGVVVERSGDITALFGRIRYLQRDSDTYQPPTRQDLDVWRLGVGAALRGDLNLAAMLLQCIAPSYKVVRFTDTSSTPPRPYFIIIEATLTPTDIDPGAVEKGWGTYFFDPSPARDLAIEVPHPVADLDTEDEGLLALVQLRPRALLLFGSHRCASNEVSSCGGTNSLCGANRASDASHGARQNDPGLTNAFEVTHEDLLRLNRRTIAVQLHGNVSCNSDVLLSNAGSDLRIIPDGNVARLRLSLNQSAACAGLTADVCDRDGAAGCGFCGTTSQQGRWTNGSTNPCLTPRRAPVDVERFIHAEQSSKMRQGAGRQCMVGAIAATQFIVPQDSVQFSRASYAASETPQAGGGARVTITVTRAGTASDLAAPASVSYETLDGAAKEATDYDAAVGTVRFAPNETLKSFDLFITDDVWRDGDAFAVPQIGLDIREAQQESLTIRLKDPEGTTLGARSTATVLINSDDPAGAPQAANPIDLSAYFVRQHYRDFLNREPDAPGLAFWTNEIEKCGPDARCREVKRINVSAAFFLSIEFQETGYFAYLAHQAAFDSGEHLALRRFLSDVRELSEGVVVGVGDWQQRLEQNKQEYLKRFVRRPELLAQLLPCASPADFVDRLDANTYDPLQPEAGGALSPQERDQILDGLTAGGNTADARALALRKIVDNAAYRRRQSNKAFVLMQYFGYLRRAPDQGGYDFWLSKLNQFNGNFIKAEMVRAFITSLEYRGRFGSP